MQGTETEPLSEALKHDLAAESGNGGEKPPEPPLQITTAGNWRRGDTIELPSGNVVRADRPSLLSMISSGEFPNALLAAARRVMEGDTSNLGAEELPQMTKVIELIVTKSLMEPRCVLENPKDGELSVSQLTDEDKQFILNYVQRGIEWLKKFRAERATNEEDRPGGEEVRHETEQAAGDY